MAQGTLLQPSFQFKQRARISNWNGVVRRQIFFMLALFLGVIAGSGAFVGLLAQPQSVQAAGGWNSGTTYYRDAKAFAAWRGSPVTIYECWADTSNEVQSSAEDCMGAAKSEGWSYDAEIAVGLIAPGETLSGAAGGDYESRWRSMAQSIAANWGDHRTVYIRPGHEMNGSWFDWSITSNSVGDFKEAFKRYHGIIQQELVQKGYNAKVTIGYNGGSANSGVSIDDAWPGDQYVDVIGIDYYDAYWPGNPSPSCHTTQQQWDEFVNNTNRAGETGLNEWIKFAKEKGKPIAFPEWGLTDQATNDAPCDNPLWIQNMHDFFAANAGSGPGQVLYEMYFNIGGESKWRWLPLYPDTISPNAAAKYKSLAWGGGGIDTSPGAGTPSPTPTPTPTNCSSADAGLGQAKSAVSFPADGAYTIWARIKPTATANSFKLDIDGNGGRCGIVVGDSSSLAAGSWQWVNYAAANTGTPITLNLGAGTHNVTMTGTEAGLEVDKLIFSQDTACAPTGSGGCSSASDPGSGGVVDTAPPKVTLSKPASGETISATYNVTAVATDNVAVTKTELLVDNAVQMTNSIGGGAFSLNTATLTNGVHSFAVRAYDAASNSGLSPTINVTINNGGGAPTPTPVPAPVITSLTATPSTVTAGAKTTIAWKTSNVPAGGCTLSPTALTSAQSQGSWTSAPLTTSINYTLICVNGDGTSVSKSVSVVVNPAPSVRPTTAPTSTPNTNSGTSATGTKSNQGQTVTSAATGQTVTNGATGGIVSGDTTLDPTNITNASKEKSITKVEYYDGTNLLQTDYTAPYTIDTTQLKDGTYTITELTHYTDTSNSEVTQTLDVQNISSKTQSTAKKGTSPWVFLLPFLLLVGGVGLVVFLKKRGQDASYDPYLAGIDTTAIDTAAYPPASYGTGVPDWQQGITQVQQDQPVSPVDDDRRGQY